MDLSNEVILLWGLGLDAWITIATVIAVIAVMLMTKVRTDAFEGANDYTVELLVSSDNPNICKTLGEAGLFHVKGGSLIAVCRFQD